MTDAHSHISQNQVRDWDDLKYFLAVYETGSFSKAGERLNADQSTVGRRIAALEARLGARLFDRHHRGTLPTRAARNIVAEANAVREAVHAVERAFDGIYGEAGGTVRVAATEGLAAGWLTPRLGAFRSRHPDIHVELVTGTAQASIEDGEADLAIRLFHAAKPGLVGEQVGILRFALYTVAGYADVHGMPRSIDEMTDHHRIVDHTALTAPAFKPWRDIVDRHPSVAYRTNSSIGYQWAVQAGYGIGLFPVYTPKIFADLLPVPVDVEISVPIWLVSHEEAARIGRVHALLDYVRELFRRDRSEWFS